MLIESKDFRKHFAPLLHALCCSDGDVSMWRSCEHLDFVQNVPIYRNYIPVPKFTILPKSSGQLLSLYSRSLRKHFADLYETRSPPCKNLTSTLDLPKSYWASPQALGISAKCFHIQNPGGGGTWLADGRGSVARFSERYPLLITESCRHTHFYDEFWRKPPIFCYFRQFLDNPPLSMENLRKKGPLFREFGAQKPTHMGGTYPYPQHVMYPPPPGIQKLYSGSKVHDVAMIFGTTFIAVFQILIGLNWI